MPYSYAVSLSTSKPNTPLTNKHLFLIHTNGDKLLADIYAKALHYRSTVWIGRGQVVIHSVALFILLLLLINKYLVTCNTILKGRERSDRLE